MDRLESIATDGRWWELDLAPGWFVASWERGVQHLPAFELDRCVALVAPREDEVVRVYAWDSRGHEQTAAQWVQVAVATSGLRGSQPTSVWRSHTFAGAHASWEFQDVCWSVWWLAAEYVALHAMHRTGITQRHRGRAEAEVEQMLRTVRIRAPSG